MNRRFEGRKFRMMAVSIDNNWEVVRSFYEKHGVNMPTYLDPGHQVSDLYKVFKFPETFILDENGSVLKHFWFPPQGWPQMMSSLDELLKKQETADRAAQ
jgi:peroxiredoxin